MALIVQWWRHCTAVTITITLPFAKDITTIVNPSTFGRIMWNLSLIPLWPAFRFGFYEKDVWKRKKVSFWTQPLKGSSIGYIWENAFYYCTVNWRPKNIKLKVVWCVDKRRLCRRNFIYRAKYCMFNADIFVSRHLSNM